MFPLFLLLFWIYSGYFLACFRYYLLTSHHGSVRDGQGGLCLDIVFCVLNSCLLVTGTNLNKRQAGGDVFAEKEYTQLLSECIRQRSHWKPNQVSCLMRVWVFMPLNWSALNLSLPLPYFSKTVSSSYKAPPPGLRHQLDFFSQREGPAASTV